MKRPLDTQLVPSAATDHEALVTMEGDALGAIGDHVLHSLALQGLLGWGDLRVQPVVCPDRYCTLTTGARPRSRGGRAEGEPH